MSKQRTTFKDSVYDLFKSGKDSAMYQTYVNYALSTNERGETLVSNLSKYIKLNRKSYLDIGTAYGGYIVAFATNGCKQYFGFDIDERLVKICKMNLAENGLDDTCVIEYNICNSLPTILKYRKFDIITCVDVMEHVMDVFSAIEHIKSLIANGGYLYLEIPNRYNVNNIISDPHFGLYGITLLERNLAIEYFKYMNGKNYMVGDYYDLAYFISLFPKKYYQIEIMQENIDFEMLYNIFNNEVELKHKSKINDLPISIELKNELLDKFEFHIKNYKKQLKKRDTNYFYIQSWKLLIRKKGNVESFFSIR